MRRPGRMEVLVGLLLALTVLGVLDPLTSAAGGQANEVYVEFGTTCYYDVSGDSFANSQVMGGTNWGSSLNRKEGGGIPVCDVRLRLYSTVKLDRMDPNPDTTGPPVYDWSFGDVPDDSGVQVGVGPGPSVSFTPGFDASRSADKTRFTATENQTLTITATPRTQMNTLHIDVAICQAEYATATIIYPTRNESRGIWVSDNREKLNIGIPNPILGANYTFTVITEVTPNAPEVEFMPKVGVGWMESNASGTANGSSVSHSMPGLGVWTWSAAGTYDWQWRENLWRNLGFDGYCRWPRDTSPPAIRDLTCTTQAPFRVSARMTDNVAVQSATLAIFSADDYRVVQQLAGSTNPGNDTDIDLVWDGNGWALTNGTLTEDTSMFAVSAEQNIVVLMALFDRDGEGGENGTTAFAWFDPATLRLVNLTVAGPSMTPLTVISGLSTISPVDLYVREGLMKEFLECIPPSTQDPMNIRMEERNVRFVITVQDGGYNIRLAKKAAPPGEYILLLVAGDTSMNQAWCFVNHTLSLQGSAEGKGLAIWGVNPSAQAWLGRYVYHENISRGDLEFSGSALLNAFLPFSPPQERGWVANGTVAFEARANATWAHAGKAQEVTVALSSDGDTCLFYLPQYDSCMAANLTFEGSYTNGTTKQNIAGEGFFVAIYGAKYDAIYPDSTEGLALILQIETPFVAGLHLGWSWENASMYFPDAPGGRVQAPAAEHVVFNLSTHVGVALPSVVSANFSATPRAGPEPLTVAFTDLSESDKGVASWLWSFGDGSSSTERNPSHRYNQDGTYTVSLMVREAGGGSDAETKVGYITVADAGPTAWFQANPTSGVEPLTVNFTDGSASHDRIVSWLWSFGDGSTSWQASPRHLYVQDGTYQVSLTVTDEDGNTSRTSTAIAVSDSEPEANFSAAPATGSEPLSVQFGDTSSSYDGIVLWSWDFGDGSTSKQRNPIHIYSGKGSYQVSITVWESDGDSDVKTIPNSIVVHEILLGPFVPFLPFLPRLCSRKMTRRRRSKTI